MAMSELGAYLQRQREERGLGFDEVEARTRIRRKYVEAMEAGEWDTLPPGVYTRGLLRNYARLLGVSPASVLRMYIKERPSEARLPAPSLISQPLIRQPRFNVELIVAVALLAVAVGLFSWMVGTQLWPTLQQVNLGPGTRPVAPNPTATREPSPVAPTPTAERRMGGKVEPLSTRTPAPTATSVMALELEVEASSDAWLMVHTDGDQAFMGFLREGESRRWSANERVRLRTGNAGGTQIPLNGQSLNALGDPGAVEEYEWRLLPNGDIEQSS